MTSTNMRGFLVCSVFTIGLWCTAVKSENIPDLDNLPPVEPTNEKAVPEDAEFIAQCRVHIGYDMSQWIIKKTELTESAEWGLVWRLHYSEPDKANSASTLVCWRQRTGEWVTLRYVK